MNRSAPARDGASQTQRFPFTFPAPGSPDNKTLDYSSIPCQFRTRPDTTFTTGCPTPSTTTSPYSGKLSRSTVLTLSYVGTQGHRLISQYDANPGNPALCLQLIAEGATPTCDRDGENEVYTLPNGDRKSFGTRDALGPGFGVFSQNNSFTANIANSNYNSRRYRGAQSSRSHFPGRLHLLEGDRQFLGLRTMGELSQTRGSPVLCRRSTSPTTSYSATTGRYPSTECSRTRRNA